MLTRLFNALIYRARWLATSMIRRRLGLQVRALDAAGFVLVSNNCLAGQLYEMAGLRKATPTAGLYFLGDAYPRFLEDLAAGDTAGWAKIDPGKFDMHESQQCPVLRTGEDSGIVFLHYREAEVAARKWNSRFPRLDGREKVVIASLRDGLSDDMLDQARGLYRHLYIAGPAPAPPADEFVLDRRQLARLADFLRLVPSSRKPVDQH